MKEHEVVVSFLLISEVGSEQQINIPVKSESTI